MTIDADLLTQLLLSPQVETELRAAWSDLARKVPALGALAMSPLAQHHKDNVEHTILVTAKTPPRLRVRLLGLFHDVGKPTTRALKGGEVTFHHHEAVGERITRRVLPTLGYPRDLSDDVARLVGLSGATKGADAFSDSAVRRIATLAGPLLDDVLDFVAVDVTSKHPARHQRVREETDRLRRRLHEIAKNDEAAKWRPVLSGDDVMHHYDLPPGPRIGELLRRLSAHQRNYESRGDTLSVYDAYVFLDGVISDGTP